MKAAKDLLDRDVETLKSEKEALEMEMNAKVTEHGQYVANERALEGANLARARFLEQIRLKAEEHKLKASKLRILQNTIRQAEKDIESIDLLLDPAD